MYSLIVYIYNKTYDKKIMLYTLIDIFYTIKSHET